MVQVYPQNADIVVLKLALTPPVNMARVLLIEDDYFLRAILKSRLEELGHWVIDAPNAKHAKELHIEHGFNVVLTDLLMPEKDGFELISEFRQFDRNVRVIAMSAGGQISAPDYLDMARQLGACDILKKPVTDQQLASTLSRALAPT
ncbi:MAG TPA: response regulator [Opitutaceae bacterium]|nr:response regulator [Opitutaceae bacterium]